MTAPRKNKERLHKGKAMNEEKLNSEIFEMHDSLNKAEALLRGIAAVAETNGEPVISDIGLTAEVANEIIQNVYERLERLPKAIEEGENITCQRK